MKYVMVTHLFKHWDELEDDTTYFADKMLRGRMEPSKLKDNTKTVFIRLNWDTRKFEKAWSGEVYGIKRDEDRISFKVKIEKEIELPPEYSDYHEGWYLDEDSQPAEIDPPFFHILKETTNYQQFEDYTYWLLKLLGIHEIHKFERQKGTADGFFKFNSIVVIYDTTLSRDFLTAKDTQINNYCDQLKKESIHYQGKYVTMAGCRKQVWIVTRGTPRKIKEIDGIVVKEVPINSIISVYRDRLFKDIGEDKLEDILKALGS